MRAAFIAGCDTRPVLEFTEHILDFVALFVEGRVVFDLPLAVVLWRNTRLDPFVLQGLPGAVSCMDAPGVARGKLT